MTRLKVSIGKRLFFAVLLSFVTVAAIGVVLVRWRLSDSVSPYAADVEWERLNGLASELATRYRLHDDWSFLPEGSDERKTWLRNQLMRRQASHASEPDALPPSPSLGYRIGLLDRDRHYLAGMVASPAIIAVASIDTIRQTIVVDGADVGYLIVAKSQNPDDELTIAFLLEQQNNLLLMVAMGVLLSALAAFALAAHFRQPIRRLVDGTRRLGQGHFDARLPTRRSDELGELATTFNQLASKLQDTERWRQQWMADTSHELRTPLSVLRAQLEAVQDGIRTATPDTVALMLRQVLSLTALVDDLHELARVDQGQLQYEKATVDAWQLVMEVFESFSDKFRVAQLAAAIVTAPPRALVHVDAKRLRQVLVNLLENSVRYTEAGGRIDIAGALFERELHITLDDTAPAVPLALIGRLGERFFRVEESRNRQLGGAGLGLAISRHMVEAHGGHLDFAASVLGGLRVTVVLPLEG